MEQLQAQAESVKGTVGEMARLVGERACRSGDADVVKRARPQQRVHFDNRRQTSKAPTALSGRPAASARAVNAACAGSDETLGGF
jgi:hypothetical protein